ncbi:MAG: cadherin-like beta sandwich domain-containing protein [Agathobacter sp.]|nr:cadherin-like beta sandwich domain-containing protein [Agathobacter sp.]
MKNITKRALGIILSAAIVIAGGTWQYSVNVKAAQTDADFVMQMQAAGFPDSYIDSLAAVHAKHPAWQFEAVNTGLEWSTVIEKESRNGWNLVPKSSDDARKSTASGAYDWYTNTWTVYDGSSWVGANSDYIAYCMDPRNFLDETNLFQFERLSYSSTQTIEGVQAILAGTFMENEVEDADGTTLNYAEAFVQIGQETGVSPYHLASRVRQEQGLKGTSSLISGTYKGYEGYYNYFNVGASGVTSTLVIQNGLAYAKNAGWDTRYKALLGGAKLLAKNYISVGQDTLYFQKFNVVNHAALYSHQYMSNVTAAITEGKKLGEGYTDKKQAFVFRIPVYNNMPESAVTFTATGNPNNYLKSLEVTGYALTPSFDGATKKYSIVVEGSVDSISIAASAVASTSSVTGTGKTALKTGTNTFKIICASQSGNAKKYTLTVVRQELEVGEVTSSVYKIGSKYITSLKPGVKASDFLGKISAEGATLKVVDASGKEKTGKLATGNKLQVYDSKNELVKSYEIVIYGDANGDGDINVLDMIKVNRHILGLSKLSGCYLTAADANRDNAGVNVLDMIFINRHALGLTTIKQD